MALTSISIIGAGPAGASAAVAARRLGARVHLAERSQFPRHKVCGEFVSPEILIALDRLRLRQRFLDLRPAVLEEAALYLGGAHIRGRLPRPAFGLSRYRLDQLLYEEALAQGATVSRDPIAGDRKIIAHGRKFQQPKGNRLFGFKAHFEGPLDNRIAVYFFEGAYVGINAIEDGKLNVCGLAPESLLAQCNFQFDELTRAFPPLRQRLRGADRTMEWLATGPVHFPRKLAPGAEGVFPAGDALAFVDPFTGSGLVSAVATGILAAHAATNSWTQAQHQEAASQLLRRQMQVTRLLRRLLNSGWAASLAQFAPPSWLFRLTRPRVARALLAQ